MFINHFVLFVNPSSRSLRGQPGYLIIFNQEKFRVPGVEARRGSQKDEQALCRTLFEFGFNPTVKRNLKLKELDRAARDRKSTHRTQTIRR